MPKNKRESLLFTFIMCFLMVLWMSIYNVARQYGHMGADVIAAAWIGFPPAYVFAMLCDWFVASPLAKGFAFKHLVTPGKSSPRAMTLAISTCMVFPMVIIMSLYGAFEGALHAGTLAVVPMAWLTNIPWNFIMALPWNLLVAGPVARFLFRRAFPEGDGARPAPGVRARVRFSPGRAWLAGAPDNPRCVQTAHLLTTQQVRRYCMLRRNAVRGGTHAGGESF